MIKETKTQLFVHAKKLSSLGEKLDFEIPQRIIDLSKDTFPTLRGFVITGQHSSSHFEPMTELPPPEVRV